MNVQWPPPGIQIRFEFEHDDLPACQLDVVYELYDGVPCFCKWIEIKNGSAMPIKLDRITTEILALVEKTNWVETREGVDVPRSDSIHVETDFAFGGFNASNANRHVVHWETDPEFSTQVNYLKKSPCLLKVSPENGPTQTILPSASPKHKS